MDLEPPDCTAGCGCDHRIAILRAVTQLAGWLGGLAVIFVPGFALAVLLSAKPRADLMVAAARAMGLGLVFWPLLFLWSSFAGMPWSARIVRLITVAAAATLVAAFLRRRSFVRPGAAGPRLLPAALVLLLAVTVATRVIHASGLVTPPWVDSLHHTMIIRLLIDQGAIPVSYEPFIPHSVFYYHWGFHADAAAVAWLTGLTDPFDLPQLLLGFGQLLNALTFISMYAAGRTLFRARSAALLTATLACLVSFYPAYYLSWGRYTHLAGTLVLVPIAISLHETARRWTPRTIAHLVLLTAGLLLIHARVAVFAATFSVALLLIVFRREAVRVVLRWAAAAAVALFIVSPWILTVARTPAVRRLMSPPARENTLWETPNAVPADILWSPNNVPLMILGTAGTIALLPTPHIPLGWRVVAIVWWAAVAFAFYKRWSRRQRALHSFVSRVALVSLWSVLTVVLINLQWLGLPRIRPLPNSAALITMFLPLSLLAAGLITWFLQTMFRGRLAVVAITVLLGLAAAMSMRQIINPATVLVQGADIDALRWIREKTPADASFAVSVQPWIGESYVGIDGGYWIPLLTSRRSILPAGLYSWTIPAEERARVNRLLWTWSLGGDEALDAIRTAGVTHVYFGPANGSGMRNVLRESARPIYEAGGVSIFELR